MIEVHAPHERITGFRDFLLHLLTITIGLLIAVGLEGLVEMRHHSNLRAEADHNMKLELRDNRKEVASVRAALGKERADLINLLKYLEARTQNRTIDIHEINIRFNRGGLKDASWRTASATGALGFMEYTDVQKYSDAYELQNEFQDLQRQTLNNFLDLESYVIYDFDPSKFAASDAETAKPEVRLALAHLNALDQIGSQLDQVYAAALE